MFPVLYAVPKEEKGHTVRERSITICSIGFDIISSSLLHMKWYKLVTQSAGRCIWLIRSLTSYDGNCNDCDITVKRTSRQVEWFAMILCWSCVKNRRSVLSLDWCEWFYCKRQKLHQRACRTCSTILFPHSTNQIIDLWRCRRCCRRRFVQNSPTGAAAHASSENAHGSPSGTPWLRHLSCACANFLARLQGSGWSRGARRTGFHLFLPYTKRISRNDPWDVWSNLHLFIANVLD